MVTVVGLLAVTSLPQPEATRPESPAAPVPALVARTVAIDDPGALLSLLPETIGPDQVSSWVRRGEGLVGWGRALEFRASGPGRFAEAQAWWRSVVDHAVVRDDLLCRAPGRWRSAPSPSPQTPPPALRSWCPKSLWGNGVRDGG